jgi:phage FluMu protein Com
MNCPKCKNNDKIRHLYDASFGWKAYRCQQCGELFFKKGETIILEEKEKEEDE